MTQKEFMEAIADVKTLPWDWPGASDIHARIVVAAAWVLKAVHRIPDEEVFEPTDGQIAEFVAATALDESSLLMLKGIAEDLKLVRREPDPSVFCLLASSEDTSSGKQ